MSEFTQELRLLETDEARWKGEARHLLDAIDARVRALEGKFVTTGGEIVGDYFEKHPPVDLYTESEFDRRLSNITSEMAGDYEREVERAVLAERERCAKVAEKYLGTAQPWIADEIRRGA